MHSYAFHIVIVKSAYYSYTRCFQLNIFICPCVFVTLNSKITRKWLQL